MKHYGDITKLNGYELPVVDCITGGSPCQDLSVAGKRAGLDGERSGLFMEQVRIVREMREHDRSIGRTNEHIRPRYMVWENVPGAFSSNGGADFQAVLSEIIRIVEPESPDVPLPDKGKWTKSGCVYDEMGGWSIAWRVHDAQFWGVPQRRKRIALVADFGGLSAPEICFERKSVCRNFKTRSEEREETTGTVGISASNTIGFTNRGYASGDVTETLRSEPHVANPMIAYSLQGGGATSQNSQGSAINKDVSFTLNAIDRHAICKTKAQTIVIENHPNDSRVKIRDDGICQSLTSRMGTGGGNVPLVLNDQGGSVMSVTEGLVATLRAQMDGHPPAVLLSQNAAGFDGPMGAKAGNIGFEEEKAPTLNAGKQMRVLTDAKTYQNTSGCLMASGYNKLGVQETSNDMYVVQSLETFHCETDTDTAKTLKARDYKDPQCVAYGIDRAAYNQGVNAKYDFAVEEEKIGTQVAIGPGAVYQSVVRRLTPMECERLQGFPDGWTDIGEWVDSKGKKHKDADSPRYKSLGNSIALPFWFYLLRRISAQYERPATLGSLFDGIGGFPLCWERCNGEGTAIWASEIEEFPIAVTKLRFPEAEP